MESELQIFCPNELAIMHSLPTSLSEYENTQCKVVGLSAIFQENNIFYVIELCKPYNDWSHIVLTNACLRKLS